MDPKTRSSDLRELLAELDFVPETVVRAASRQPGLFLRAAQYRMSWFRRRVRAEALWKRERARAALRVRQGGEKEGKRLTEGHVEALLLGDVHLRVLQRKLARAEEGEEYARLLVEAYRMRRDSVRVIGELTQTELAMARMTGRAEADGAEVRAALGRKYGHRRS